MDEIENVLKWVDWAFIKGCLSALKVLNILSGPRWYRSGM